jgi:RNA polymerase sigma-70 factor (ECF subfamily)
MTAVELALSELPVVYRFLCARVGSGPDAEDLTQQVALKALPHLSDKYAGESIRAYLFASARSALASYWSQRLRLPVEQLRDDAHVEARLASRSSRRTAELDEVLARVRPHHRRLLELRYLRGYTIAEVASEMGKTSGAVKVMQKRALVAAAAAVNTKAA